MNRLIIKGNIISADSFNNISIYENGYIVAEDGVIREVTGKLDRKYGSDTVTDYKDALIMQSFTDMHLHAPQYPMLGMGLDMSLLEWLNTYTFPTEAYFRDEGFARSAYSMLAKELIRNGTTRVVMFSSIHRKATLILMEELDKAGITGYVGKVNMDRNGGRDLEEETGESIRETLKWLDECKWENIKPIITPRFTPSCTNELMQALGKIAEERNLPIQSHLSENVSEQEWVSSLHPDCSHYYMTYEKYGLWNGRTVMAHCVWSDEEERKAMKESGVWAVHCPSSNITLTSGYAPVKEMIREGMNIALGSDIAGGDSLSMFSNTVSAIKSSKARHMMLEGKPDFLTVEEAFYLASSAPAAFFGEKPGFAAGNPLNAIVLTDSSLPSVRRLSVKERFERSIYRREPHAVKAVYSNGKKVL